MGTKSMVAASVASIAAVATPAVRAFLTKWTAWDKPGGVWRIIAIVFALANFKGLPFAWHLRIFRGLVYQLYIQPKQIPPFALFQPLVTSTRTPLMEMDYNIHKSNSTYFSDMDISRLHHFTALIRPAMKKSSRFFGKKAEGRHENHMVALGGVMCLFKKEIKPYQKFEMWTRVLSWDRKWFYLITHLVKPGIAKPKEYSLQPWRKTKGQKEDDPEKLREKLNGAVLATGLAEYVVKKGRLTIPPEQVLIDAEMVPVKPEGWVFKGQANGTANGDADGLLPGSTPSAEEWNWDAIEAERLRGLELAEHFAALDGLHGAFDGGEGGAWGVYPDLLFA